MLFALANFLLFIFDEVSDSSPESFLRVSLAQRPHNFLFLMLEKGFRSNCSASRNLITKILFWPILKWFYISFARITFYWFSSLEYSSTLYEKRYCSKRLLHFVAQKHYGFFRLFLSLLWFVVYIYLCKTIYKGTSITIMAHKLKTFSLTHILRINHVTV